MKFVKWSVFFLFSFFISWIVIATFSQAPFREAVPVRIVFQQTRPYPIYYFIAIAFALGLCIGLAIAVYNFIMLKAQSMKRGRRIRELEDEISRLDTGAAEDDEGEMDRETGAGNHRGSISNRAPFESRVDSDDDE